MPPTPRRRPGSSGKSPRRPQVAGRPRPGSEEGDTPRPSPRPRQAPAEHEETQAPASQQAQDAAAGHSEVAGAQQESPAQQPDDEGEPEGADYAERGSEPPIDDGEASAAEQASAAGLAEPGAGQPDAGQPDAGRLQEEIPHTSPVADLPDTEAGTSTRPGAEPGPDSEGTGDPSASSLRDSAGGDVDGSDGTHEGGRDAGEGDGEPHARRSVSYRALAIGCAAGALGLIGLAGFFGYQYNQASAATDNKALIDASATAEVQDAVSAAVETLLSYDYNNIEETEQAANDLLVNEDVRETYNSLYEEVKRVAPEQEMVLETTVSRIGVMELSDDEARLLVLVDQSATREGEEEGNVGGSQLSVGAQRTDGEWKISDLDTYVDPEEQAPGDGGQPPDPDAEQQPEEE